MPDIVEQSLCRSVELLGEMIDSQRQEIRSYKEQIDTLRAMLSQTKRERDILESNKSKYVQGLWDLESMNANLKKELELYKHMVATLEDELLKAGVAPATTGS